VRLLERLASPEVSLADVVGLAAGLAPKFDNDNLITNVDVLLPGDAGSGVEGVLVENLYGLEDLGIDSWIHVLSKVRE
jgi:hypothetical protein